MPRKVQYSHSSSSSTVGDADESSSRSSVEDNETERGSYAEGKTAAATTDANARTASTALCPAPVRLAIGVFSTLTAVTGAAVAIVGGNALNSPSDPQADLHRAMLGAGVAVLGLGACGALSTFIRREYVAPPAPSA